MALVEWSAQARSGGGNPAVRQERIVTARSSGKPPPAIPVHTTVIALEATTSVTACGGRG